MNDRGVGILDQRTSTVLYIAQNILAEVIGDFRQFQVALVAVVGDRGVVHDVVGVERGRVALRFKGQAHSTRQSLGGGVSRGPRGGNGSYGKIAVLDAVLDFVGISHLK